MQLHLTISFEKGMQRPFDHSFFQGFWYGCMDQKTKRRVHSNIPGLFSSSNIYVEKSSEYQANTMYNRTFSTCDQENLTSVYGGLLLQKNRSFGDNTITIHSVTIQPDDKIWVGKKVSAMTPIVISLDQQTCKNYDIATDISPLFWMKEHGFEVRLHQLHKNTLKKYIFLIKQGYVTRLDERDTTLINIYDREDWSVFDTFVDTCNFFSGYKYRRNAVANYKGGFVGGSVWDLIVANDIHGVKVLKHVLPIGLGERCTAGFGFMK